MECGLQSLLSQRWRRMKLFKRQVLCLLFDRNNMKEIVFVKVCREEK